MNYFPQEMTSCSTMSWKSTYFERGSFAIVLNLTESAIPLERKAWQ